MPLTSRTFLQSCLQHMLRWTFTLVVLAAVGYATFIAIRFHHLDTRLYAWFSHLGQQDPVAPAGHDGLTLQGYALERAIQVAGVGRNLSGLAFDPDRQQLIAVVNRPATLLRLSQDGSVQSRHALQHAADVEGVAYLGAGRIALVEEGRSRILFAQLPETADAPMDLRHATALRLSLETPEKPGLTTGNQGFEGLAYDARHDYLYVAKEHSPRALYRISGMARQAPNGTQSIAVENLSDWVASDAVVGTDLSSAEVDSRTGHLLLLSDESQSLVELDEQGRFLGRIALSDWLAQEGAVPQAEGIAIDPQGGIYLVSEPNLFYRLRPPPPR